MNKWVKRLLFVSFSMLTAVNLNALNSAEEKFHQINNVIFSGSDSVAQKNGVNVILNEIFSGYGGAFRVDSVFKPVGEERYLVTLTGLAADDPNTLYARIILACHELGHLIGGAPYKTGRESELSAEGQADYVAVNSCMKDYYQQSKTSIFISDYNPEQMSECSKHYSNEGDQIICLSTLSTINSLVTYWNKTLTPGKQINLFDKDPTVVAKTKVGYPSKTCRIQTMVHGALGLERPTCWYNPNN